MNQCSQHLGPSTEAAPRPPSQQLEGQTGASGFIMTGQPWLPRPATEEPPSLPGGMEPRLLPLGYSSFWWSQPKRGAWQHGLPPRLCLGPTATQQALVSSPCPSSACSWVDLPACPLVEQLAACSEGVCGKWVTFVSKNGFVSSSPLNNLAK